jgi:hypothetical protein
MKGFEILVNFNASESCEHSKRRGFCHRSVSTQIGRLGKPNRTGLSKRCSQGAIGWARIPFASLSHASIAFSVNQQTADVEAAGGSAGIAEPPPPRVISIPKEDDDGSRYRGYGPLNSRFATMPNAGSTISAAVAGLLLECLPGTPKRITVLANPC